MTPNEGRGRLNLPSIKDDPTADQLAPQQGGPSSATAPPAAPVDGTIDDATGEPAGTPADDDTQGLVTLTVQATRARQQAALARVPIIERSSAFFAQIDRWNRELTADLTPILGPVRAALVAIERNVEVFTALEALEAVA